MHALRQSQPDRSIGVLRQIVAHNPVQFLAKFLGRHLRAIQPHDGKSLRKEIPCHEIVYGRKQLPLRKVAIDAENDHDTGST